MVLKIEKDHQRFRQIVKGRIREDLRKFLTKGELIGKEGKHLISIPVRGIETYQPVFDQHAMPKPVVPENDPRPWIAAIGELLGDREVYERESARSREAAERFIGRLDAGGLTRFLAALRPATAEAPKPVPPHIEALSPEKRALLLQRLHQRGASR